MRRLHIYRRGTDSEVGASERSSLWQGMGYSPPDHMRGASAGWPSVLGILQPDVSHGSVEAVRLPGNQGMVVCLSGRPADAGTPDTGRR
jgi:hypothetical protein